MNYEAFVEKYRPVLDAVSEQNLVGEGADAHTPDVGVAAKMIECVGKIRSGELTVTEADNYKGVPEDFDFVAFGEDFRAVFG